MMDGKTSEFAPTPEPAPAPKPPKVCKRCGMAYEGTIAEHRAKPVKRGGCMPTTLSGPALSEHLHGKATIEAVREEAQHPETDDQ